MVIPHVPEERQNRAVVGPGSAALHAALGKGVSIEAGVRVMAIHTFGRIPVNRIASSIVVRMAISVMHRKMVRLYAVEELATSTAMKVIPVTDLLVFPTIPIARTTMPLAALTTVQPERIRNAWIIIGLRRERAIITIHATAEVPLAEVA